MNVVYLFYESDKVRIPFYDYDPGLFQLLINLKSGKWDNRRHEFTFMNNTDFEHKWNFPVPFVAVHENSPKPMKIFKFINPIEAILTYPVQDSLPQKFSEQWQKKLEAEMRARKFSPKTRRVYIYFNRLICRTLQKTPEEICKSANNGGDDVTQFLATMEKDKEFSSSSLNLAISAIKFFYRNIMKTRITDEQRRPARDRILPVVLSKDEIKRIINTEKNPKHRLLLIMAYSSGLRVSEVVALKKEHIDLSRKVVYIKLGKGRKDRNTLLAEKAIQYILDYYKYQNIERWIFPGQIENRPLSIRTAQKVFCKAVKKANIQKDVSIHCLRHTFATHLLEDGIDIRYIQELLGHSSIRTTEKYTHVAKRQVLNILSPLDTIL
jgi:site-specific recombinase XerD